VNGGAITEDPNAWRGALVPDAPLAASSVISGDVGPVSTWFGYMLPTFNQKGDSCVGHAWANWIEAMVRRYIHPRAIPEGEQIDGRAIWKEGRRLFWGNKLNGGLHISQGFEAAVSLGWIPEGSDLVRIAQDWNSVNRALLDAPLVQGHFITPGWFDVSTESGCINHEASRKHKGGHATLLCATLEQDDDQGELTKWRVLLNSWGSGRGRYGYFTLKEEYWLETAIDDGPYMAEIEEIEAWTSWTDGLIKK